MNADAVTYTLTVINNSSNPSNFAVFQQDPSISPGFDVFSLAWFSKYAYPSTTIKFSWTISYNFVWSQTGVLAPGVVFDATQNPAAGLKEKNQISLDYDSKNGAYFFDPQIPATTPPLDQLRVIQTANVPLKQASVGIGMSGFGTFVVQAQPNITVTFNPHPKYYIIAGNIQQGQVLDIKQVTSAPEVVFPPGVYQMTAILGPDNTWVIKPTQTVNQLLLESKKDNPEAKWGKLY
jgi:hypothetical protein